MRLIPTAEQHEIVSNFRKMVQTQILPVVTPYGEDPPSHEDARRIVKKMTEFGFGSFFIPEAAGGMGVDLVTGGMLYEELAYLAPGIYGLSAPLESCTLAIHTLGNAAQQAQWVPRLAAGEVIACVAITEPGTGSNVAETKMRAIRDGEHFVLRGEKTWISNGMISDMLIVVARMDDGNLALFLVEREHGYDVKHMNKLGFRNWSTAQIFFDDVRIPAANLIGEPGVGLRIALRILQPARAILACIAVGTARAALDAAIDYAKVRSQFGKPIASFQLMQAYLAEMATEIDAARLLAHRALAMHTAGMRCDAETAMCKWYATEMAVRVASKAIQIHGSYGVSTEYPVERLFRDARMMTILDGTTEIQKLIIGRALTGISAFT